MRPPNGSKWWVDNGKSYKNGCFRATPILGKKKNIHMYTYGLYRMVRIKEGLFTNIFSFFWVVYIIPSDNICNN